MAKRVRQGPQQKRSVRADSEQSQRFIEAARELGADQSEEAFNEALRKVARAPVAPKKPKGRKPRESSSEG